MADRSLLSRATESTEAPTPGYLYVDIAKNAASSPVACSEIATYLTRRLATKQNPNIKYKCCKVIAKTAQNPVTRGQFQRVLSQDSQAVSAIKDALVFRGPPDPARGDEPYQKVRTAAKEALDAIYSDQSAAAAAGGGMMGGSTMQGIGSGGMGSAGAGGGATSGGSGGGIPVTTPHPHATGFKKMEGIGNPRYKDPRLEGGSDVGQMTVGAMLNEAGRTIGGMIRDPLATGAGLPPPGPGMAGYRGGGGSGGGYGAPPGRDNVIASSGGQWTMASNRGPNAVGGGAPSSRGTYYENQSRQAFDWAQNSSTPSGASAATGGVGGSWGNVGGGSASSVASRARQPPYSTTAGAVPPPSSSASYSSNMGGGGTAASDGTYEKNLIMELCPPGGMKPEPPPDKLRRFQQAIPSLDPDLVCPALLDCLEDGNPWIIRAKALCVMEACITVGEKYQVDGSNKYADFFFTCRGEVEPLVNHPRAAISQPAKRVLALLGIEGASDVGAAAPTPRAAPASVAPAPTAPAADLLDFGAPEPAPAPAPAAPTGGDSLFGGLKVQGATQPNPPAPAPAPATVDSLLGAAPAPAPTPTPSGGGGLFDSMTVKSVTETPAPAPSPAASSGFDFMNSGGSAAAPAAPAPAAPAPAASSGFDFMQQNTSSTSTGLEEVSQAAAASGSAFSFMGGGGDVTASAGPAPAPTKASFDPLNSGYQPSPNSQKASLDPVKLQAMYAQQNMMLMQQQMQQMQLAMAMQQQKMQRPQRAGSNPNVMVPGVGGFNTTSSFSFLDHGAQPPSKKEDKKFDFVQDAMRNEKKK